MAWHTSRNMYQRRPCVKLGASTADDMLCTGTAAGHHQAPPLR